MKTLKVLSAALLMGSAIAVNSVAFAGNNLKGRGSPESPVVYVSLQNLFYDSFVLTDLPLQGNFQKLEPGVGPSGFQTDFGPGDEGYYGGRWWIDVNGNNVMDEEGDLYFLCPLVGPGRDEL